MANSAVFNFRRHAGSDWISLTEVEREFQARDAAAGNARSPMVARRVGGTSVDVEADRRRRRPCTSAVNWSVSARYGGAVPWRQRCVRTHKRICILSGTFNQCSSRRSGVMCSDLLAENTSWAAAFNTDRRRCNIKGWLLLFSPTNTTEKKVKPETVCAKALIASQKVRKFYLMFAD